jgi:hypothetical protein
LPGSTRQSIRFARILSKKMDARIICAMTRFALLSGHDDRWQGSEPIKFLWNRPAT